jgi:hypothetical protein
MNLKPAATGEPEPRYLLAAAAGLLDQGEVIDRLSRPLTIAALIGLVAGLGVEFGALLTAGLLLVALAGLMETYLALRTGFDAALFHRLAGDEERGALDLGKLDAALLELGLLSKAKAGREVEPRVSGARRLLTLQGVALALQVAVVVFGTALITL